MSRFGRTGGRKRVGALVLLVFGAFGCREVRGGPIDYSGVPLVYHETFDSLSGTVTWNDGATIPGWYLKASRSGFSGDTSPADGIPDTVAANTGGTTTSRAYHLGNTGSSDRALGWVNSSSTGAGLTGMQIKNVSGRAFEGDVRFSLDVEQWANRSASPQPVELQYTLHSASGNQLTAGTWSTLATGAGPTTATTGSLNGNTSFVTLAGLLSFPVGLGAWNDQESLWFRIFDPDHTGTDNAYGIDNVSLEVTGVSAVPEPGTWALMGLVGPLVWWRTRRRRSEPVAPVS